MPESARSADDAALTGAAVRLAEGVADPVCAYVPVGPEPGGPSLVDALVAAGHDVLLPIVPRVRGPLGLREPGGPRLGVEAIGLAGLVLVPGLAVDREGVRLGRGAGYYDRTLPYARARLVIVLYDNELVERLPAEPHDHRVTAALLPHAGLVTLGKNP